MNSDHLEAILEDIRDQNKAVLEAVGDMQQKVALIPAIQSDLDEVKQDVRLIKAAVTDTNRDLRALEVRVDKLEAAA